MRSPGDRASTVKTNIYSAMAPLHREERERIPMNVFGAIQRAVRDPVHDGTYSPTSSVQFRIISILMEDYLPEPLEVC